MKITKSQIERLASITQTSVEIITIMAKYAGDEREIADMTTGMNGLNWNKKIQREALALNPDAKLIWTGSRVNTGLKPISSVEYNSDLDGFIVILEDDHKFMIQFEKETNRLHADYNKYLPFVYYPDEADTWSWTGIRLDEEAEEKFLDMCMQNTGIKARIARLNEEE